MDPQIVEQLRQQRQDALDAVSMEMAFEEERCRITLQKLHSQSVKFFCLTLYPRDSWNTETGIQHMIETVTLPTGLTTDLRHVDLLIVLQTGNPVSFEFVIGGVTTLI